MRQRQKRTPGSTAPGVPTWFLTYADTVTLLMTFFVMLMGFSTLDDEKFEKVRGSLMAHMGMVNRLQISKDSLLLRRTLASSRLFVEGYENPPEHDPIACVEQDFQVHVRTTSLANVFDYKITNRGFEIHILAGALFEEGSATLMSEAPRVLKLVGNVCRHLPHPLRVLGHSDAFFLPAMGWESPEELALERAAAVCRHFHEHLGIATARLSTAARIRTDDSLAGDAQDKQVTIIVLRPTAKRGIP